MKYLLTSTLIIVFALQAQAQNQVKKHTVKLGKIEIILSGSTTGSKTIYFDDYGEKHYEPERSMSKVKTFCITDRTEKDFIQIIDKSQFWAIDNIEQRDSKN